MKTLLLLLIIIPKSYIGLNISDIKEDYTQKSYNLVEYIQFNKDDCIILLFYKDSTINFVKVFYPIEQKEQIKDDLNLYTVFGTPLFINPDDQDFIYEIREYNDKYLQLLCYPRNYF